MTDEELDELARQDDASDAMRSGCTDYACDCHHKVPRLVAEIRRQRRRWQGACEALAAETERCARLIEHAALSRWPDDPLMRSVLKSLAEEIRERGR